MAPAQPAVLRAEIQALRAVAVVLVVVCHVWPAAVPGGFVGVDVFFAISGFLITSLLLREIDAPARLAAGVLGAAGAADPARRAARRCSSCALATLAFVPAQLLGAVPRRDRGPARCTCENWQLAHDARSTTSQRPTAPSPVQHFWSLSVEEQFYLVWPLLIARGLARGRRRASVRAWRLRWRADRASLRLLVVRHPQRTRRRPTSSRRPGRGSSARAACWRCARGDLARRPRPGAVLGRPGGDRCRRGDLQRQARRSRATRRCCRSSARLAVIWAGAPPLRWRTDAGCSAAPVQRWATCPTRSTCGTGRC